VVDKSTGEFAIGAGYSTSGSNAGPSVEASITERNFLGRGQYIRIAAGGGKNSRDYTLSFTEPYFLGRRIAAGFDIFRQSRSYDKYTSVVTGATVRFGLPITENLTTQLAYNISQEEYDFRDRCQDGDDLDLSPDCVISPAIVQGIQDSPWIKSSVSGSVNYTTIDDVKNPHDGIFANITTEVAGLGGDAKFVKLTARGSYYQTLSEEMDIVGVLAAGGGHIEGFDDLRVFDYFQSNERMIRGFEHGGIGPVDSAFDNDHLGGKTYFHASAEAQFPIPGIQESFGLRGAVFVDAATLFGNDLNAPGVTLAGTGMEWRASAGAGLIWASPFGPLRINYAYPFLKEPTDEVEEFSFGVSTRF
jgi:outer membrane protein insertion porin family